MEPVPNGSQGSYEEYKQREDQTPDCLRERRMSEGDEKAVGYGIFGWDDDDPGFAECAIIRSYSR
jgi:hypothetical protein